ncbi:hypothetical protein ACGFZH_11880 [Streptomyces zaomyceticus]|uniref:hypothetical protein n=1 Tax=Streptomyces TaxID=1883 RepID=UPI00372137A8
MATDERWLPTDCAGLEICRDGNEVRGLRLLGWQEVLPRSLAAALGDQEAPVACPPVLAQGAALTELSRFGT